MLVIYCPDKHAHPEDDLHEEFTRVSGELRDFATCYHASVP